MSERIARVVQAVGLENDAVVVGGSILEQIGVRQAHDVDVTVPAAVFRDLRETAGWHDATGPEGIRLLRREATDDTPPIEVGTFFGEQDAATLRKRGTTVGTVAFAGLHDIYAWKQSIGRHKDVADVERIKARLFDRPLGAEHLGQDLDYLQGYVPEHLREHPALIIAANGLYITRVLYGDPADGSVRAYSGFVEEDTPAFMHHWGHTANGAPRLQRHIDTVNARAGREVFDDTDRLSTLVSYMYHDVVMGEGRCANNPEAYDEKQSGLVAVRHLMRAGLTENDMPDKVYAGDLSTGFNEVTKSQDIQDGRGHRHIQEATSGVDLATFHEDDAPQVSVEISAEDQCRVGAGLDRPLSKKVAAWRAGGMVVRNNSLDQALALIDTDKELLRSFADRLENSGKFCIQFTYPKSWTLDRPARRRLNGLRIMNMAQRIRRGELRAADAGAIAAGYRAGKA